MNHRLNTNDHCHQKLSLSFGLHSLILHADRYVDVSGSDTEQL
jgi:hypothetical protein